MDYLNQLIYYLVSYLQILVLLLLTVKACCHFSQNIGDFFPDYNMTVNCNKIAIVLDLFCIISD